MRKKTHPEAVLVESSLAHDDGLGLFEQQTDSELLRILASKDQFACAFMTAVHRSMSNAELDQVRISVASMYDGRDLQDEASVPFLPVALRYCFLWSLVFSRRRSTPHPWTSC